MQNDTTDDSRRIIRWNIYVNSAKGPSAMLMHALAAATTTLREVREVRSSPHPPQRTSTESLRAPQLVFRNAVLSAIDKIDTFKWASSREILLVAGRNMAASLSGSPALCDSTVPPHSSRLLLPSTILGLCSRRVAAAELQLVCGCKRSIFLEPKHIL